MEVMEARLIRAAELNGELDDDDSGTVLPLVLATDRPWVPRGHSTVPTTCTVAPYHPTHPLSDPVSPRRWRMAAEIRAGGAGDRLHQETAAAGAGG